MQDYHSSRRSLIKGLIAASLLSQLPIGAAIASDTTLDAPSDPKKIENAKALVLSCIDFRFIRSINHFLETEGLEGKFDWTALAGASLALSNFPHPAETEAFWDQLDISYKLHHVRQVIICDHQDCGAYEMLYPSLSQNLEKERNIHSSSLHNAKQQILKRYPDLQVKSYFATLSGQMQILET